MTDYGYSLCIQSGSRWRLREFRKDEDLASSPIPQEMVVLDSHTSWFDIRPPGVSIIEICTALDAQPVIPDSF